MMGFINAIRHLLVPGQVKEFQEPITLEAPLFQPIALETLPAEVLLQIRSCLPASSASIFSICCMKINQLIGMSLSKNREDILGVGELLARDLCDKVACSICFKLHNINNARKYLASQYLESACEPAACVEACWRSSLTTEPSVHMVGEYFSAIAFKMVMKRYHQNSKSSELLNLMSPKAEIRRRINYRRLLKVDCLIVQGSLMYREQSVFVSPEPSMWSKTFKTDPLCYICTHLEMRQSEAGTQIIERFNPTYPADYHNPLQWEMDCNFEQSSEASKVTTSLRSCNICKTEFRIDFKYYPRLGLAMYFTRWKDLGTKPDGEDYTKHTERNYPFRARLGFGERGIAARFEGGLEFDFDSIMTTENEGLLFKAQKSAD